MFITNSITIAFILAFISASTFTISAINVYAPPTAQSVFMVSGHMALSNDTESDVQPISTATSTDDALITTEERGITQAQARIVSYIAVPLNTASLILSLCVVFAYLFARHYRPAYANRVSLRLTVLLAAVDAFYALFQLLDTFLQDPAAQPFWCTFAAWGYVHCTLLSVFLTSAVALNLHIIFLRGHRTTPAYEVLYLLIPMAAALIISLPPVIFQKFGYDPNQRSCWYIDVNKSSGLTWAWFTLYIWLFVSIGYCAWAVSVVGWRLAMERKRLRQRVRNGLPSHQGVGLGINHHNSSIGTVSPPSAQVISRVVARVILYPIIPVLTQSLNVAVEMDSFVSQHISFPLIAASFIATACQGSLNALVFLLDPTVRTGWYHVRLELIKRYYLDLQENKDDDAFGTYERPTQANRNYIPQNNKDKIASLFNALFFPLRWLVRTFLRYWVYHFLLVHRNGRIYLTEYDTSPLDATLLSKVEGNTKNRTKKDDDTDDGHQSIIGGLAGTPRSKPNNQQPQPTSQSQPSQSAQRLPSTANTRPLYERAVCYDSAYAISRSPNHKSYRKPQDMAFLLSGSPRPDSGIEGATESGFTAGSSASLENKSKLPLPRIPNPSLQWPNISTGITVQPSVITSLELAPVKATVVMLNMTLNQKKLNPYKFPTPIPLSHTRRAARLPADCIAAHIGIKPVKAPISVDLYERSLQRWSDQDLDDLIALL